MFFRTLTAASAALVLLASSAVFAQTTAAPAVAPAAASVAAVDAGDKVAEGKVAHYGGKFNGRKTANGERFNVHALTMAHKTLPFGSRVKVTNLANQRSVVVRVNDRGPSTPDRIGDLTTGAARKIGMLRAGVVEAKLEVMGAAQAKAKKA